ncbi:uncharacterized protein tasor2 isoform X2 [Dicentrarchus labrax]|uniref:uncharacterized protein tasor2 isoform X2 n=1 Tax=Dicentrarchus labrax TaxID=13489 RepID=UPI0021F626F6|nr:uncharacterized protein tasor2 isoform X2 [Dicentrarchus labrax]
MKGVLVHVSASSEDFKNNVLAPLKSAYLYEESKQSFRYKSAVLIKNPALERKYNAFRARRREEGYSEEDLKESYGFLLFDDVNKANALGETGVLAGNSTCTTLGDPSKGVYISMYSDCLDQNRWYHGKSGYIAIIRLTKGRVKRVLENYTQNFTAPTEGFDCHVSEQLPSVSSKTSSFLAFERTQYYMYELPGDGSNDTALSPSGACPFAIVPFSYTDTKATLVAPQEKSEEKKLVCHYFPWSGQLQIGTHCYDVGLRSTAGALIPAELPPVVKVDRAISMLDLRQLLPRTIFETCLSGEVFLDGLHCSLYEMVSSEVEETSSLSLLLWEIKEKDVALIVPLNDGGFLILLHSSHFFTYDDSGSSAAEVLQGMFVFPESRVIYRGTKGGQRKPALSSEILRVLPVLSYAEGEVEKTPIDPSEELCEVFAQHMQSYAALINPGLALSPSRDISIFPDQYDVQDAHKHLYSSPEWTNRAWQSFRSYLSKPDSFQLPVSKASEILAAGQQERIEDLDDDVYFCLSSPEEAPANHVSMDSEDQLTDQKSGVNVETSVDSSITSAEAQVDLTAVSQNAVPDDLQAGDATKDTRKSDLTLLIKADDMGAKNSLTPSTSDDLPAELIVSITSAERTLTARSVISTESADETVKTKEVFDCSEVTNLTKTNGRKLHKEHSKGQKHVSKACNETPSLQTVNMQVEDDNLKSQKEDQAKVSSGHPQLSNPSNTDWRKVRRRKRIFGKLSAKNKKVKSAIIDLAVAEKKKSDPEQQSFKSTIVMELDPCPHRKKTERWDLKPVISTCGRILVPHGYVDIADQIKTLKDKSLSTKDEQFPENMLVDDSVNAEDRVKVEKESSTALETAVDKTEATTSKGGGNHPQNVDVSNVSPEHSVLRQSEDGSGLLTLNSESSEHHSKNDGINTPFKTVQEKHTDTPSSGKCAAKGEFLLSKLKSVLLRGKRKTSVLVSEETTADTAQDTQPCLKKGKVDSDSGKLKSNETINPSVQEVSKMVSVDPLFAFALGLTPKETPDKIQKSQGQDTQQRKDSSETQEQTILDKQPQIIQRPLSIFPRRSRIKTLKKHQGVSAEHVRKKWWLHFQTPACFASEKLKYKECTRDNSVRKTVKEKSSSACSSTDALNLLADLALSASNDQVPPQPEPALEREPETSLKKCDLTLTSAEQESVLHALLRQPAARPIQPHESPSPSHLVGGSELVGLVSKEHAYSLPPSSSLLLGLSGTPFQVSPLSGSTRLLHHHQTMYGDGIKTLHPCVDQEDGSEHNSRFKKHMVRLRKFRHSRTFVNKDGSIQVTRQWKENYDFNLDSKFTCDSKDKAIIRALHGPWDYTIQDTNEEVRLIVHMWIGLFYSRSTARFFHVDSNSSEGSDSLEKSHGMMSAPAQTEFKADPFAPFPNVTDTTDTLISKALDLSKKNYSVLDQGTVILDLSLRNSSAEIVTSDPQVNKKMTFVSEQKEAGDTLNSLKSSMEPQNASTFQCYRKSEHATDIINEMNNVQSTTSNKRTCTLLQKAGCLEHTDVPPFKGGGIFISVQEDMVNVSGQPGNHQTAPGIGHVLHGCNNEKTDMKDGIENSQAKERILVQRQGWDSFKPVTDKDSNKKAGDVVHVTEPDEIESKDGENREVKEKPYQEGTMKLSPKMIHKGDESTNKEPGIVCNGNILENEMQSSREEPKTVSPDMTENVNEDMDCFTVHKGKVIEDDHFGREDGLDRKDCCISDVEAHSDLNNQPLPMSDGPDSVKEDCVTECNRKAPLDEHPSKVDNKEDAPHDLQLRTQCANGSTLTEENVISEKAQPGMEPVHNEPTVEENPENGVCLAELNVQPLPMSDGQDSAREDCITECNLKAPLDKQPAQADNKEDTPHYLQLRTQCANGSELTEENAISENVQSGMEPVHNEPTVEENPENGVCLADLNDHPLPMMCDGPDSVKDCITECNRKAPLDEQLPKADNKEHARYDLQLRIQCSDGSVLTEENAISEKAPTGMEPIHNKPAGEENQENGICLADLNDQPLPMMCDGPDSVKDCVTKCNLKAPLDKQPSQADNKEDSHHDLQLRTQCANGSELTEENAISENAPSAMEPVHNKPAVEENPENGICLADLNDQLLPMICDGPDSVKKDNITECNRQAPLNEQPPKTDNKENACYDLQLRTQCGNGSALTEENAISENTPSGMEPIHNKPAVEESPENGICLADLNDQPIPMMCDNPDSVKKDCITECNHQEPLDEQLSQADNEEHACHDLEFRKLCGNGSALTDEHTISEKTPNTQSEIYNETVAEENSEKGICLADKAHYQEAALPTSDERTCSLDGSSADGSIPQINDSVEIGSPNKVMANFSLSSADHEDGDAKSVEEVSHLPECKGVTKSEAEVTLPKEMALKSDTINKGLEKIHCRVVIPFIGIDTSGEDAVQPHDSHSECKVEEFQGQKGIPFISDSTYPDTVLPTEICSTSQLYSNNSELFDGKISLKLLDVSETNQPEVSGSESDDRCPTPTMDEKPYQYVTCSGPSSSSVFSGSKTGKNMTQKCLTRSSSFLKDKMPLEQKHKSTVNSDPNLHFGLHPDLELRTLRVLQSIDKFLFKSSHTDNASQIKTGDVRHSLDQIPNTSSKYIPTCLTPSHIFADFKGKKISNTKSVVVSACTSQELQTESSGFKSIDSLQAIKPNVDQDKHKTTLHTNLSHEPRSYSQRPVMAVKPSKSDEVQGDCILKDRESENSVMSIFSKDKPTKSPVVPYTTPAPMLFKKKTESLEGNSEGLNDNQQEASELSNSDLSKFGVQDPSYKGRDIPSSFLPMQSFEYAKTSSKLVDENQIFLTKSFDEKIGQMAKESIEMDQKDCPGASTSVVDYKDDSTIDDSLFLGPESSLTCTVYNTGHDRSYSFLEQLSQRCLQDDLTRASMEQECLIFSQQMQQLLKRSKRGPIHQLDEHDKFNLSSSSPVTVHFSSLEEQEDSVDHLDALSLVGQKIKVDMSDTKDLADTADEGNALHPQNLSEGTGNQMEHAGVSGLTAECARQYTAMMNDVVKRVPSRPKHFRMDRGYSKTEQSNHFDFCGQMKREMDESFRSSLNSVVKKSCKTKYRFYILVTSDDAFFEETKAQLEAEGHSAVQPSDFFLGDDSSSSLLIILKNEDIAEHICEVPHLLELKKSPSVQFAGIDEPDDVVNLTHQELFMRGGFIMFDRAALESLSLCNMKKMAEILQELSRTGKWKWMLHYRDSRRLKENARLTAEAKEKKHFINWCQEVGILEALPYHECDLMSRDQPDYLTCLVRLQVQNISARYPIFITDTTTDIAFGTNGILTMNFNSFLTCSPSETFTA